MPKSNRSSCRKCLRFSIVTLINTNYVSNDILNKIDTHGFQYFTHSCKMFIINNYDPICNDMSCYVCKI